MQTKPDYDVFPTTEKQAEDLSAELKDFAAGGPRPSAIPLTDEEAAKVQAMPRQQRRAFVRQSLKAVKRAKTRADGR